MILTTPARTPGWRTPSLSLQTGAICRLRRPFGPSRAAAERAISIDPELAEGYAALALSVGQYEHDLQSARSLLEKSLQLDPNYASGHQWLGEILVAFGECEESLQEMRRALALDPLSAIINSSQVIPYLCSRDYQDAEREALRALDLFPDFENTRVFLGHAYVGMGDLNRAREQVENCGQEDCIGLLGMIAGLEGRTDEARAILEVVDAPGFGEYAGLVRSWILIGLGEPDEAMESLKKASTLGFSTLYFFNWQIYDPIREDPRFRDLLTQLGYP